MREVSDYHSLMMLHVREDLKIYFNNPNVDILPWNMLCIPENFTIYDTVVLMEFPVAPAFRSKHRKFINDFIKKYSGKKFGCYPDPIAPMTATGAAKRFRHTFMENDITEDLEMIRKEKMEVIYGSDLSLCLWTPYSYVYLMTDFNFPLQERFEKATFCFEKYEFIKKAHMYTLVDNLCYRISSVPASYKTFVMPCSQEGLYVTEFVDMLQECVSKHVDEVLEFVPTYGIQQVWKHHIWDFDNNEMKGVNSFESIK